MADSTFTHPYLDKPPVSEREDILVQAALRSLNWLASYPGDGALGAYKQMRAALAAYPEYSK